MCESLPLCSLTSILLFPGSHPALAAAAVLVVVGIVVAGYLLERTDERLSARTLLGRRLPLLPGGDPVPNERVTVSAKRRMKHFYAIGATGSGKTNLLMNLIGDDIAHGRSVAVFDLRGDLIDRILRQVAASEDPREAAERLVLLDLRDTEHAISFNPLLGPGDPYNRALYVLAILRQRSGTWGVQLEETLRNALVALAETGWSLLEIEPLLMHAGFRVSVLGGVTDPYVLSFFARYDDLSKDQQRTWALAVLNKVTPLLSLPALRRMFGARESLDMRALFDDGPGKVLLVALAVDRLHEAAHIAGGLLVSSLQNAMMARADMPEERRIPVHLYLDEFETMASDRFEAIIAEGRRFGLGLTLSHQNLVQLPVGLRQLVLNNAQTQVYFRTGAQDAAELAREIVSEAPREAVRTALMTQGIGEAFLVRRGQESVRIAVPRYRDPALDAPAKAALEELKAAVLARTARAASAVDAELSARREALTEERDDGDDGGDYEVRYARTHRLKP